MGPFTPDQIVGLVRDGALAPLDYLYDEGKADWVLFIDHDSVGALVRDAKPKAPPKPAGKGDEHPHIVVHKPAFEKKADGAAVADSHEWFVLKGDNKFGPFSYTDVIKMLQQGVVFEFDFAWHEGLETWKRIAEVEAFSEKNIKSLKGSLMPEINEVFFRRRHRRVRYGGTILVHDNKKVWKGYAVEISEGGAGVVMDNALVVPGQQLYLHFKPGDGVPPFNAVCEVVSKKFANEVREANASVKYGLKFLTISADAQKVIQEFTKSGQAA